MERNSTGSSQPGESRTQPRFRMRLELSASRFCRTLNADDIVTIRAESRTCRFPAGSQVFQEGDPGDGLYVILEGVVDIKAKLVSGNDYVLSRMEPGDYFGEMAVFDGEPRSATAVAREAVEAVFIPVHVVQGLVERNASLGSMLVRDSSLRLREFNQRFLRETLRGERLALVERLARSIVHDFRTPLSVISMAGEMAAASSATPSARQEALERIKKHVGLVNQMLQELVDFTRGPSPPLALPKVIFADFLRDALLDLQTDASRRGVQLVVEGALPDIRVRLDKPRFSRVFMNLSQNAFDAVSGLPNPRLTLRLGHTASHVIVEFVDNGKGIEAKNLPHLFEPFFTYGKAQGTGLGLPICERIVQDHGGKITAHSEHGQGATFTIILPVPAAGDSGAHQAKVL